MKVIRPILFLVALLAVLPPAVFARSAQVRGIDPEQEMEVPVGRSFHQFEPDRRLLAPESGPYDPLRNLKSPLEITRAEAASYIGWARRYECADALVSFLSRRSGAGPDIVASLWALGQVGSPAVVPCLVQWARKGTIECRIEALRSLSELESSGALPVFLEGFTRTPSPGDDPSAIATEHHVCFESLVALGNRSCLPPLERLAEKVRGRDAWNSLHDPRADVARGTAGREAVALLAACGDAAARGVILNAIVAGSRVTEPAALLQDAAQGGNLDGFPWGFWIGKSLLMDNPPRPTPWPALCAALELLKSRPVVLDAILRDAALNRKVPDGGKALLLGCLTNASPADIGLLEAIWSDARGRHAVVAVLAVPAGRGDHFVRVPYNLNASAVVYALSRLKRDDTLLTLWNQCPERDLALKGDLAVALARTGARRFAPLVADYVSREWDRAARSPELERRLGDPQESAAGILLEESNAFEFAYRSHDITRFLVACGDRATFQDLTMDPGLHPYVRLFWIQRLAGSQREPWMMDLATKALAQLESEPSGEPKLLATLRTRTKQTVQSLRNRGAKENPPLQ